MFLDQLIGISNSYLINWCILKLKSFREDTRNYIKPKKWYRELQNIVTIDGKTLKPEYKMSAVSHFKGYNMAQCEIDRNNLPKKLTFIGIWNNRNNNIEIGVLIKKSGIDGQNNLIIGHLNVINNVDFRSSVIQLQKCSGCELDNLEQSSKKNYNCNILINANDSLIIGIQSNSVYHRQLLEGPTRKFEIYTDGSVRGFGFYSEISYFPSSNKAKLLAVILALIVLPSNSEVTIYTDSNNVITGYYDIIDRNNFIIMPRKFFKIRMNNIYWNILREIIVTNNLTLDFIKVKGHSDDYFNNYIDEFITHTDELSNLIFKPNNLNNLDYILR
ncbi:unnamed protein product [Rhizophagus irregularis]|nr:unnamed protein product [Rhizophagus irregularis]